jgi:hypothetical protein
MTTTTYEKLASHLKEGSVYRRDWLSKFSKAVDRDLMTLVKQGILEKVGAGLYYRPALSRFGVLPPNDHELVKSFLKEKDFLLYSWNQYNTLGLGLTQLYNRVVVYNRKRFGVFTLANKEFDFKRPSRGFPRELSQEFLLVDLVNNLSDLAEDVELIKAQIKKRFSEFNRKKVLLFAKKYGKVSTCHFFQELKEEVNY